MSDIKEQIRSLPREAQLDLISFIVDLMKKNEPFELSENWKKELIRRDEAYRSGEEKLATWEKAKAQIVGK